MNHTQEQQWIAQAQQGDQEAFEQLVHLYVVVEGGVPDKEARRISKNLVERLDRLYERIYDGQRHKRADHQQKQGDGDGPAQRAGEPDAAFSPFHLVQMHSLLHHASPPPSQVSLRRAFLIRTQDMSIIANSTTAIADA